MKNKDLIAVLNVLSPEDELVIAVKDISTGEIFAETYDIDYSIGQDRRLSLVVMIEPLNCNHNK